MARLRMAVIGVGHLGKEHARILAGLPEVELVGVVDVNAEQAETVARRVGTRAYRDYRPLLSQLDAAVLAVPTSHHHALADELLRRGLPLLIEKPLAATREQADDLVAVSRRHGALVQVGHIERFNPAFEELQSRPFRPKFVSCERLGAFTGRSTDVGVVLDVMVHDLDLLLALVAAPVRAVRAVGVSVLGGHEDVAHAHLEFADGCVASVSASRVSAAPARRMHLWGAEGYASLDFARRRLTLVQPSEQLRQHGLDLRRLTPATAALLKEEMFGRHLQVLELDRNAGDQLTRELQHFVTCVQTGARPRVGAEEGRAAVALAAQVLDSLRGHAWEGRADGPVGPAQLPPPCGLLFRPFEGQAAA
jgi:predicted dehydrogenase